ncbi:hypothetical protein CSC94_12930 [Zhengella mangrovi]|uniref:Uncharacterized protein n=1 Tax=Zhengella mangrovi TaxID=1982044 RepID=A0A2G1QM85_9HYPH|nr:hypothetical protein CSC94_12930 [Zhengella mangrovi]
MSIPAIPDAKPVPTFAGIGFSFAAIPDPKPVPTFAGIALTFLQPDARGGMHDGEHGKRAGEEQPVPAPGRRDQPGPGGAARPEGQREDVRRSHERDRIEGEHPLPGARIVDVPDVFDPAGRQHADIGHDHAHVRHALHEPGNHGDEADAKRRQDQPQRPGNPARGLFAVKRNARGKKGHKDNVDHEEHEQIPQRRLPSIFAAFSN